jgi:CrcB protein
VSAAAWVAFVIAGAAGAPARYLVDVFVQDRTAGAYPWGTFVINVVGSLLLGVLTGLVLYHGLSTTTKTVLGTGFCGAFTTFSTFTFETVRLAEEGAVVEAGRNVVASLTVAAAAAAAGIALCAAL